MLHRLYLRTMALAEHPHALWWLFAVAFIEASVFPIPPDVMILPMVLAARRRAWLIPLVALAGSVLGGALGYAIGAFAFESVGRPILEALGKADAMDAYNARFNEWGFWAVLGAGLTPFPYKVITIMSGWTGLPLSVFMATSVLARGLRFFAEAALLRAFGAPIREFIEKRLGLVFTVFLIVLVGGFVMVKYL